jgi:hypothetical protein
VWLFAKGVFCDPGGEEVDYRAGFVGRWLQVPAPVEVRHHLAVGLASQPKLADPAGSEFVLFALGVVFENQDLEGVSGDRAVNPGALCVQFGGLRFS